MGRKRDFYVKIWEEEKDKFFKLKSVYLKPTTDFLLDVLEKVLNEFDKILFLLQESFKDFVKKEREIEKREMISLKLNKRLQSKESLRDCLKRFVQRFVSCFGVSADDRFIEFVLFSEGRLGRGKSRKRREDSFWIRFLIFFAVKHYKVLGFNEKME